MYNMNTSSLLGVAAESGPTPRTPEIVNSLISMTNPFDRLRSPTTGATAGSPTTCHHPSSPGPSESASSAGSPPSVQHTCSQLIKEGLKLTLQTKRKNNGDMSPQQMVRRTGRSSPESQHCDTSNDGLTPEDEERRRRRRERNKIAATKCRLKKRERTVNLVYESEILETQNHDLKSKIQELETQRRRLVDVLSVHRPTCSKQPFPGSSNSFQDLPRSSHQLMEAHSAYSSYSTTSYSHHQEVYTSQDWGTSYPQMGGYNRPMGEPVYTNLSSEVRSFSSGLPRPSNLLINTSSSDYESNTEVVDSPSTHHHPSYTFDEDGGFNPVFPTTSCIT